MIRILLVDDHQVVRAGIAAILSTEPGIEVVGQAGTGRDAVRMALELTPDITFVDLQLPDMGGFEVIAAVRERAPEARFIVLTVYGGDEDIFRALEAGARAYLRKDVTATELLRAIACVQSGERYLSPAVAARLAGRVGEASLTAREHEVLVQVAAGKTNKEIARLLGVSEGTVKSHLHSILQKLGSQSRSEAIATALRRGLIHEG